MKEHPIRNWTPEERIRAVKTMFSQISPRYDLLNHLLSGWQDVRWRKITARRIPPEAGMVLDVATGTGDMAMTIARKRPAALVVGVDFVPEMMAVGREKTSRAGLGSRIEYTAGDAMQLQFENNRFDAVTAAFGLRNMPDRIEALKEMARVVRPGGRVLILEMTLPRNMKLYRFFHWYLRTVIPTVGGIISGNRRAYQYLPDSIEDFIKPEQLTDYMDRAGLTNIRAWSLTFGITYLHEGTVP